MQLAVTRPAFCTPPINNVYVIKPRNSRSSASPPLKGEYGEEYLLENSDQQTLSVFQSIHN